jgi:hypothetical protein
LSSPQRGEGWVRGDFPNITTTYTSTVTARAAELIQFFLGFLGISKNVLGFFEAAHQGIPDNNFKFTILKLMILHSFAEKNRHGCRF